MEVIVLALLASGSLVFLMIKVIGLWFVIRFEKLIDVVATFGTPWLFFGTFSGMALAILTGIFISIQLFLIRKITQIKPVFGKGG